MNKNERLAKWTRILEARNVADMQTHIDDLLGDVKSQVSDGRKKEIKEFYKELDTNLEEGFEEINKQAQEINLENLLKRQRGYQQLIEWYVKESSSKLREVLYSEELLPEEVIH